MNFKATKILIMRVYRDSVTLIVNFSYFQRNTHITEFAVSIRDTAWRYSEKERKSNRESHL
jgi:hypothetical protein